MDDVLDISWYQKHHDTKILLVTEAEQSLYNLSTGPITCPSCSYPDVTLLADKFKTDHVKGLL